MKQSEIKKIVRKGYADIAKKHTVTGTPGTSCCGGSPAEEISRSIGYSDKEIQGVPEGSNLGLGCGNPTALASLRKGDVVLDLGAGAGFDCFLAANAVGAKGKVIGVDMTSEMIDKARENAQKAGYRNVEFRLGEIEHLPVADKSVDVVISNCVINLSPEKHQVFQEMYRVLKPKGRFMVSDIVLLQNLPAFIKNSIAGYVGCISGAIKKDAYLALIKKAGFINVKILDETCFPIELLLDDEEAQVLIRKNQIKKEKLEKIGEQVVSIKVQGTKPLHR